MADTVLVLQEVPIVLHGRLGHRGNVYGGEPSLSGAGDGHAPCDCGIVVPNIFQSHIVAFRLGRYWCAMLMKIGLVFISAHYRSGVYDNTDDIINGASDALVTFRSRYHNLRIVVGMV